MNWRALIRQAVQTLKTLPVVGSALGRLAGARLYLRLRRKHPFDIVYGVDTSGIVRPESSVRSPGMAKKMTPYLGTQPSVVRQLLNMLPNLEEYSFVDIGCGKGRVVVVASEFPFRKVVGIELAPKLARIALKNAGIIGKKFPARTKIEIIEGDAVEFPAPSRKIVLFLYNPFNSELMAKFTKNIEKNLAGEIDHLFLIYHNPVAGHVLDKSPALKRWYAGHLIADEAERDYGYSREGASVIWQSAGGSYPAACEKPDRAILVWNNESTALAA